MDNILLFMNVSGLWEETRAQEKPHTERPELVSHYESLNLWGNNTNIHRAACVK